jgi:hypothetical protein
MIRRDKMTPFYEKALALFTRTQEAQIQKGLAKYPEPFNPHSWTPDELLNHALEETVDLTHYLVGLKELLDAKDEQIKSLHKHWSLGLDEIKRLKEELEYEKGMKETFQKEVIKLTKGKPSYDMNFNPVPSKKAPYSDLDDEV